MTAPMEFCIHDLRPAVTCGTCFPPADSDRAGREAEALERRRAAQVRGALADLLGHGGEGQ